MNDVDNKACEIAYQATCKHNGEHDWVAYMLGWQAALEYARGQQEPVAWTNSYQLSYLQEPKYGLTPMAMWATAFDETTIPLYTHPVQPVQPAGAQGDAVHFRAVLCGEQLNQAVGVVPKVVGFVDRKAAEQFILEQRDFKGWKYNLESLYTAPPAAAINEQLLEALKPFAVFGRVGSRDVEVRAAVDAIAAAEAAKGGV